MNDETLITAEELAEFLSLNLSTIKKWTASGKIPCYRIGKKAVRYDPKRITRWLQAKEKKPDTDSIPEST